MKQLTPLIAFLLAGCMSMEPAYVQPDAAVPASWPAGDVFLRQSEASLPAVTFRDIFRDARLQPATDVSQVPFAFAAVGALSDGAASWSYQLLSLDFGLRVTANTS